LHFYQIVTSIFKIIISDTHGFSIFFVLVGSVRLYIYSDQNFNSSSCQNHSASATCFTQEILKNWHRTITLGNHLLTGEIPPPMGGGEPTSGWELACNWSRGPGVGSHASHNPTTPFLKLSIINCFLPFHQYYASQQYPFLHYFPLYYFL
jgi:hypothetical protein